MLFPTEDSFVRLAERGNLIPVAREILADLDTPLSLFRRLDDGRTSFLLESVEGGERWARYSFVGVGARAVFRARGAEVEWVEGGRCERIRAAGDPLAVLRDRLARLRPVALEQIELPPFVGGAVGMVAWDWVRFVERIPDTNPDELGLPDAWFVIPESLVVYDNVRHTAWVLQPVALGPDDEPRARYREAVRAIEATVARLREPLPPEPAPAPARTPLAVTSSVSREAYEERVKRAKDYIEAGDIFQVVLSQRFSAPLDTDPFLIYRHLRRINPSPYLFFLRCEGPILIGSSPEILVRLERGRIHLRPIAGTRPRGATPEEDQALERELLADPKERAEHVMLVDLGRNDVGRVAEIGSVRVSEFAVIERYSHVMHIVSHVVGSLRPGLDWLDVLRATFPAGTLSGAPKVRAMEIIEELESLRRGPYGGCVGYIDPSGNMDMAITIRTLVVHGGRVHVQAGGGVVADSRPEAEYQESVNKAQALLQAIERARRGSD